MRRNKRHRARPSPYWESNEKSSAIPCRKTVDAGQPWQPAPISAISFLPETEPAEEFISPAFPNTVEVHQSDDLVAATPR
jgi:hypothetical protein